MYPVTHGWAPARACRGVISTPRQRLRGMRPGTSHFLAEYSHSEVLIPLHMMCVGRLGHVASGELGASQLMHGTCRALGEKWRQPWQIHFTYTHPNAQKP